MSQAFNRLSAQFNRALLSEYDFTEAENYLKLLDSRLGEKIQRALIIAAIISYARPFSKNERKPEARATPYLPIKMSRVLTPDQCQLHEHLMAIRNEALAHSQYTRKPVARTSGTADRYSFEFRQFDVLSQQIDIEQFLKLCRKLNVYCIEKQFELNGQLPGGKDAP